MRGINCAIKGAILSGMVLILSTTPALASGENKLMDEKPKVKIIKVERDNVENDKDEKEMRQEKKVGDKLDVLRIKRLGIDRIKQLLDEDILGEILEDED